MDLHNGLILLLFYLLGGQRNAQGISVDFDFGLKWTAALQTLHISSATVYQPPWPEWCYLQMFQKHSGHGDKNLSLNVEEVQDWAEAWNNKLEQKPQNLQARLYACATTHDYYMVLHRVFCCCFLSETIVAGRYNTQKGCRHRMWTVDLPFSCISIDFVSTASLFDSTSLVPLTGLVTTQPTSKTSKHSATTNAQLFWRVLSTAASDSEMNRKKWIERVKYCSTLTFNWCEKFQRHTWTGVGNQRVYHSIASDYML